MKRILIFLLIIGTASLFYGFRGAGWRASRTLAGDYTFEDSVTVDDNIAVTGALDADSTNTDHLIVNDNAIFKNSGSRVLGIYPDSVVSVQSLRAPRFYDWNNTNYSLDPEIRSYLNQVTITTLGLGYQMAGSLNEWRAIGTGKMIAQFATGPFDNIWSRLYTETAGNQILRYTGGATWEHEAVLDGHLIEVHDTLWIYYIGKGDSIRIGRAYSLDDGASWTKDSDNPLMSPNGTGCEKKLWECCVKYRQIGGEGDSVWQMYYQAFDSTDAINTLWATSVDGETWTRHNDNRPVLWNSDWDSDYCGVRNVCYRNDSIFMFYEGEYTSDYMQMGTAVGTDESTFTKLETAQPTLSVLGTSDTLWASKSIIPVVEMVDNIFVCWYGANDSDFPTYSGIGMAFSEDGKTWTRYQGNPAYDIAPFGAAATAVIDIYWEKGKLRGTARAGTAGISYFLIKESQISQFANECWKAMESDKINWGVWTASGNDSINVDSTQFRSVIDGTQIIKWDATGLTGSAKIRGTATFTATMKADTIEIIGGGASDFYWIQIKGATVPTSPITYTCKTNTLFVYCAEADTAVLRAGGYNWLRIE